MKRKEEEWKEKKDGQDSSFMTSIKNDSACLRMLQIVYDTSALPLYPLSPPYTLHQTWDKVKKK